MYNKHSVGNFGPFVSIADRAEALPEHAKRVSWPEPCLIGGGTKGPENCRECVYTWRGSFYFIGHVKNGVRTRMVVGLHKKRTEYLIHSLKGICLFTALLGRSRGTIGWARLSYLQIYQ